MLLFIHEMHSDALKVAKRNW